MGKKVPDVEGAAEAEAEGARDVARDTTFADRADQYNPWGSLTYDQQVVVDPATGKLVTKWIQKQNLSPEVQGIYDQSIQDMAAKQQFASGLLNRAFSEMSEAPDWEQFGDARQMDFSGDEMRQRAEDMAYQRDLMRLDPQFSAQENQLRQRLSNQGLSPGDRAYDAAISNFNTAKNDAYERARLGASEQGRAEIGGMWNRAVQELELANALRDKNIEEYLAKRNYSLSESERVGESGGGSDFGALVNTVGGA